MNLLFLCAGSPRCRATSLWLLAGLFLQGCAAVPHPRDSDRGPGSERLLGVHAVEVQAPLSVAEAPNPGVPADPAEAHAEAILAVLQAEFAAQRRDLTGAARQYLRAARLSADVAAAKQATRIAVHANATELTLAGLEVWVALGRVEHARGEAGSQRAELGSALRARALLRLRMGAMEAAEADLVEWLALDSTVEREKVWNQVLAALPRDPQAIAGDRMLQRLRARFPGDVHAGLSWARWPVLHGDLAEGMRRLEQLLTEQPDAIPLLVLQARMLWDMQQRAEADALLSAAIARLAGTEGVFELQLELGRLRIRANDPDGARVVFAGAYAEQPDNPTALRAYALLLQEAGDLERAERLLTELRALDGQYAEASFLLGQLEEAGSHAEAALSYYAVVPEESGSYLTARLRMALLLSEQSLEAGLEVLDGLLEILPSEPRILQLRGAILSDAARYEDALMVYDILVRELPGESEAAIDVRYARAMVYERLDRLEEMQADLQAVLLQNSQHYHALNALGYTLADRLPERAEEAMGYLERALALKPDDFYVLDSMGWAHYRRGQLEQALGYLRRAWAKKTDAEAAAHLGEVLWKMQRQEEARAVWGQGYAADPVQEVLLQTLRRFAIDPQSFSAPSAP